MLRGLSRAHTGTVNEMSVTKSEIRLSMSSLVRSLWRMTHGGDGTEETTAWPSVSFKRNDTSVQHARIAG